MDNPVSAARKFLARLPRKAALRAAFAVGVVCVGTALWLSRTHWHWQSSPHPETARYTERQGSVVPLADVFTSYDSVASASARLAAKGFRPLRSSSNKPASRRYPPRDLDTFTVENYEYLSQGGRLILEFFNDRLYEARFEPEDVKRFTQRLHAIEPELRRDRIGMSELVRGDQRISSNVDLAANKVGRFLETRPYVIWQDRRLKQQLGEWELRYGPEAAHPD